LCRRTEGRRVGGRAGENAWHGSFVQASEPTSDRGSYDPADDDRGGKKVKLYSLLPKSCKKTGAELQAYGEDKQNEPELLDELQCIMIHRFTKSSQGDPGEKHASSTQTYATEFQASERHAGHTNQRKHSNRVCDRLSAMQLKQPAHVLHSRHIPGRMAVLFMSIISRL
jgi:hypothetical protein